MKKYSLLALSLATIVGLVGLSSCSKDDPAPRPKVSFERSTQTFAENAGVVEVKVVLDVAAGEDITVDYDVDGTALEGAAGTAGTDYEITSGDGDVTIRKGQTTGTIEIKIKNDAAYEGDETVELEITGVSSSGVDITEDNTIKVTISEDDSQPVASFKTNAIPANEKEGVNVEIVLDKAAGQDITLTYEIVGEADWQTKRIALSDVYGEANEIPRNYWDFGIFTDEEDNFGEVTIAQGETSVFLNVAFYLDFRLDDAETITIKLTGAKNNAAAAATAASKNTAVVTIDQEDGRDIELVWDDVNADVNLYLFGATTAANVTVSNQRYILGRSEYEQKSTDDDDAAFEQVFLPFSFLGLYDNNNNFFPVNYFGVSANYRAGTVTPLPFTLLYGDFIDGDFDDATFLDFSADYTAANVNDPFNGGAQPAIIQKFNRVDDDYTAPTDIVVPGTGSRERSTASAISNARGKTISADGGKVRLAGPVTELMKNPYHIKPIAGPSLRRR